MQPDSAHPPATLLRTFASTLLRTPASNPTPHNRQQPCPAHLPVSLIRTPASNPRPHSCHQQLPDTRTCLPKGASLRSLTKKGAEGFLRAQGFFTHSEAFSLGQEVFHTHGSFSPRRRCFSPSRGVFHICTHLEIYQIIVVAHRCLHMHVLLCMVALHIGLSTLAVCYPGLPEIS